MIRKIRFPQLDPEQPVPETVNLAWVINEGRGSKQAVENYTRFLAPHDRYIGQTGTNYIEFAHGREGAIFLVAGLAIPEIIDGVTWFSQMREGGGWSSQFWEPAYVACQQMGLGKFVERFNRVVELLEDRRAAEAKALEPKEAKIRGDKVKMTIGGQPVEMGADLGASPDQSVGVVLEGGVLTAAVLLDPLGTLSSLKCPHGGPMHQHTFVAHPGDPRYCIVTVHNDTICGAREECHRG